MASTPLAATLAAIDKINLQDPNTTSIDGKNIANEYLYSQRMTECLTQYWPDADELLQIAVHAQHIKRWHLKRAEFPEGRSGYLTWRKELGLFHAQLTKDVMLENGFSTEDAETTYAVVAKKQLKSNERSQTLEDVACLVFLIYYFAPFAEKHSDEKIISIVQKTWRKMSDKGHDIALSLEMPDHLLDLVKKALGV